MMLRRRWRSWRSWQCLVGSALSLAVSATALAQGTPAPPAPPAAPPATSEPAPPPPATPAPPPPAPPAQPGTPPQPGSPPPPMAPPPGYPQQQPGYPPPGYPQQPGYPPPGYPQQPGYPPTGYPPPGYPQQPGYPPPGYSQQPGYPPPGYAYPPSYYARPAPPPPGHKHGFLAMVFLGVNSLQGSTGNGEDVGFRIGTIMGGRVNESFSINGELTLDVLNPKGVPAGVDVTEVEADLALSPLFHVQLNNVELVVGPKLGFMGYSEQTNDTGLSTSASGSGYVYGLNAGVFASISRSTSIGGLISLAARKFTNVCQTDDTGTQTCSSSNLPGADKVLGLTGAILF